MRKLIVFDLIFVENPFWFATGDLEVTAQYTPDGIPTAYQYSWKGGELAAFTQTLFEDAEPSVLRRKGKMVYIGGFTFELFACGIVQDEVIYLGWKDDHSVSLGFAA